MKSLPNKTAKKSSKEDGNAFENEMIESEKRMKKKTRIDGREGAAQASSHTRNHTQKSANNDEKTAERRTQRNDKAQSTVANAPSTNSKNVNANATTTTQNTVVEENSLQSEAQLQELLTVDENNLQNQFSSLLADNKGSVSLQGFQPMTPQLMTEADASLVASDGEPAQAAETLLSVAAPALEKNSSDLLSQNSEQNLGGFEFSNDFAALQNNAPKETVNTNQVFASILDAKTQNVEQVKQSNVENLVTQASALLKDGGGEMKLQLRPEGMGTVDLKVGVQNGQVSIEIMTQDQNIKRLFEDSVLDIRNALEVQNLKIDTFNVGVSENFDQSMAQQNASQFAEREFARNFMGQFRDDRQALRQQGIDNIINNRSPFSSQPEGLSPAAAPKGLNNGRLNIIA